MNISEIIIETNPGVCPVKEETRQLAQVASENKKAQTALDLGCGTGYIAIYLALRNIAVDAIDIDIKAIENALSNAKKNNVYIHAFKSSLFSEVKNKYDLIIFNPPRIPESGYLLRQIGSFIRKSDFLTRLALPLTQFFFGNKRQELIRIFLERASFYLNPNGQIVINLTQSEIDQKRTLLTNYEIVSQKKCVTTYDDLIIVMIPKR